MIDAAAGLRSRGHDVLLVARPGSALVERAAERGIAHQVLEMRGDFDPAAIVSLARLLRRVKPDAVCVNLDREIRISAAALSLSGAGARLVPRRGSEFPLKDKWLYRRIYLGHVHRVIVNSQATYDTMLSRTPWFPRNRAVVIYNGIDFDEYDRLSARRDELRAGLRESLGVGSDVPVVVHVGELNERKGHRFIVEAAGPVLQNHPNANFLFVGDGDARPEIESMIAAGNLKSSFHVAGFRGDIAEILVGCDVLVLPSRVEGFGYVMVEAMAAGLPVVATDASSMPEVVDHGVTGYLHEFADSEAIAGRLSALLADPAAARAMGRRGRDVAAQRFEIGRMLDQLEAVFFGDGK